MLQTSSIVIPRDWSHDLTSSSEEALERLRQQIGENPDSAEDLAVLIDLTARKDLEAARKLVGLSFQISGERQRPAPYGFLDFIRGMRGTLLVTLEEGTSAAWLHDLLKPHVAKVVVCDRTKGVLATVPQCVVEETDGRRLDEGDQ